jgi:hypothetical protein
MFKLTSILTQWKNYLTICLNQRRLTKEKKIYLHAGGDANMEKRHSHHLNFPERLSHIGSAMGYLQFLVGEGEF